MPDTSTAAKVGAHGAGKAPDVRQMVSFTFYRVDPAWRRRDALDKAAEAKEFAAAIEAQRRHLVVSLSYSLIGLKPDADFLIWSVGEHLEALQEATAAALRTKLGGYLTAPYLYLSMTKRSIYVDKLDPDHPEKRRFVTPFHSQYLFVYPFWKTWQWYQLPLAERQRMMDEHIQTGNAFPSVRIHTTYSFGLDDPEFMLAFETDEPKDFLDLVMQMRENKARQYTLRDTPIFTCVARPLEQIVQDLGGGHARS